MESFTAARGNGLIFNLLEVDSTLSRLAKGLCDFDILVSSHFSLKCSEIQNPSVKEASYIGAQSDLELNILSMRIRGLEYCPYLICLIK